MKLMLLVGALAAVAVLTSPAARFGDDRAPTAATSGFPDEPTAAPWAQFEEHGSDREIEARVDACDVSFRFTFSGS